MKPNCDNMHVQTVVTNIAWKGQYNKQNITYPFADKSLRIKVSFPSANTTSKSTLGINVCPGTPIPKTMSQASTSSNPDTSKRIFGVEAYAIETLDSIVTEPAIKTTDISNIKQQRNTNLSISLRIWFYLV
jgi:hypothetical protein